MRDRSRMNAAMRFLAGALFGVGPALSGRAAYARAALCVLLVRKPVLAATAYCSARFPEPSGYASPALWLFVLAYLSCSLSYVTVIWRRFGFSGPYAFFAGLLSSVILVDPYWDRFGDAVFFDPAHALAQAAFLLAFLLAPNRKLKAAVRIEAFFADSVKQYDPIGAILARKVPPPPDAPPEGGDDAGSGGRGAAP